MKNIFLILTFVLLTFSGQVYAGKVDINKADAQTLQENLDGVGPAKAKAIVDYRRKHGKFKSLDNLMQVPGIGEATIKKNRRNLSLKGGLSKTKKSTAKKKSQPDKKVTKKSAKKTVKKKDKKSKTKMDKKDKKSTTKKKKKAKSS